MSEISVPNVADDGYCPEYQNMFDAGADCRASETVRLLPGESALVDLGFSVNIPPGFVGLLCSRSGLSARERIEVANGVGVIDAGYTGRVKAHLVNNGDQAYQIVTGDRVAQLLVTPVVKAAYAPVKTLEETQRGNGGFGSTGKN
mgnify:CR=1 FL=1